MYGVDLAFFVRCSTETRPTRLTSALHQCSWILRLSFGQPSVICGVKHLGDHQLMSISLIYTHIERKRHLHLSETIARIAK